MTNWVRVLEKYCSDNQIEYHYGTRNVVNLIDTSSQFTGEQNGLIYLLHDLDKKDPVYNTTKTNINGHYHSGKMMLVVKSDLDKAFFNEKYNQLLSKYTENIEPLEIVLLDLQKYYGCKDVEFLTFSQIPISNQLDINFDGWLINYRVYIPINFKMTTNEESSS